LRPGDPAEALRSFQQAGLVLAMRLHGLILAALAGAPCAALSYDPKVAAAATAIGCPCHDLEGPAPPEPAEALEAALLLSWQAALETPPERPRIEAQRAGTEPHRALLRVWLG
jgi:polysaccharide pyruvyl transferase WcaK-like protein